MPKTKTENSKSVATERGLDAEVIQLKNQLARALADYDNLTRRTETQRMDLIKFAGQSIIVRLLPILDNLESALKHLKDPGLAIAIGEFKKILEEEGLIEIVPKAGEKLDPTLHEAIESVSGEGEHGQIAEVIVPGWKFKDGTIVRVAKVKVFQKTS